jgi:hypothetical protein
LRPIPLGNLVVSTDPTGGTAAWTAAPGNVSFNSVSCPSASLCVGGEGGHIQTSATPATASSWVDKTVAGSDSLSGLACPAASLCVAGDTSGNLLVSSHPTGGAWKQTAFQHAIGSSQGNQNAGIYGLQCVTRTLCLVLVTGGQPPASPGQGGGVLYAVNPMRIPRSLHRLAIRIPHNRDSLPPMDAINCPTRSRCVVFTELGSLLASSTPAKAATWKPVKRSPLWGASCASAATCIAAGAPGRVFSVTTHRGHVSRGAVEDIDGSANLTGIACAAGPFCAVLDDTGEVLTSTHPTTVAGTWQRSSTGDPELDQIACPTARECLAVDTNGNLVAGTR